MNYIYIIFINCLIIIIKNYFHYIYIIIDKKCYLIEKFSYVFNFFIIKNDIDKFI